MDSTTLVITALVALTALVIGVLLGQRLAEQAQGDLREQMRAMSVQAVSDSSQQIFALSDSRVRATEQVVAPVKDSLERLSGTLQRLETSNASWQSQLKQQVDSVRQSGEHLGRQTHSLAEALRRPQVRGHWGEMQLRRSLELCGVTSRCVFEEQVTRRGEDGPLRPDVVISLPGGKSVVIDSKVPLDAFMTAGDCTDDPTAHEHHLERHAKQVRSHIDSLAAKSYWQQFAPAPDFVVMFLPGEAIFAAALETDPMLVDYAAGRKVVLATPTTLIAMLKTIDYAWTQEAVADNAREIQQVGAELYERLSTVGGHIDKLGRALSSAVGGYNSMVGSLETRVLVSARKMRDLRAVDKPLQMPQAVSDVPKPLTAPELLDDGTQDQPALRIEGLPGHEQLARRAVGE
jgi:DNA recombination protein RmuC